MGTLLGRQHALTGVLAGVGLAAAVPTAPWAWRVLVVATCGGAAMLPDLDQVGTTASRALGPVTRLLSRGIAAFAVAMYHATRRSGDPAQRRSGHRLFTHTVPGCVLAAALMAALCRVHPAAGAVACGLLAGLLSLGLSLVGGGLALAAAGFGWWLLTHDPTWWWLLPVAVAVGAFVHVLGDLVTDAGVPLLWPLPWGGRRWGIVTTPVTFTAGDTVERRVVAPLLTLGLLVAGALVLGAGPWLLRAWDAVAPLVSPAG